MQQCLYWASEVATALKVGLMLAVDGFSLCVG